MKPVAVVGLVLVSACSRKEAPPTPAPPPSSSSSPAPAPVPASSTCTSDKDCVPAECCHAKTCSTVKPRCEGVACSMTIMPDTLDVGRCACRAGACVAQIRPVDSADLPR